MLVKFIKSLDQNFIGRCCKDLLQNKILQRFSGAIFDQFYFLNYVLKIWQSML